MNRPRDEVYRYFRDLERLPTFMTHLESVKVQNGRSKWRAKGPLGIADRVGGGDRRRPTEREPGVAIVRRFRRAEPRFGAIPGCARRPRHRSSGRALLRCRRAGALGAAVAKLFGAEPGQEIADDLRRLKQIIETGEVLRSDAGIHPGPRSARPPKALREGGRRRLFGRALRGRRRSGGEKGRQVVR